MRVLIEIRRWKFIWRNKNPADIHHGYRNWRSHGITRKTHHFWKFQNFVFGKFPGDPVNGLATGTGRGAASIISEKYYGKFGKFWKISELWEWWTLRIVNLWKLMQAILEGKYEKRQVTSWKENIHVQSTRSTFPRRYKTRWICCCSWWTLLPIAEKAYKCKGSDLFESESCVSKEISDLPFFVAWRQIRPWHPLYFIDQQVIIEKHYQNMWFLSQKH